MVLKNLKTMTKVLIFQVIYIFHKPWNWGVGGGVMISTECGGVFIWKPGKHLEGGLLGSCLSDASAAGLAPYLPLANGFRVLVPFPQVL